MSSDASLVDEKSLQFDDDGEGKTQNQSPVRRLLTPFLSKKVPPTKLESERKPLPLFTANLVSRIFLFWLVPLLNSGYKRTVEPNDLWYLDDKLKLDQMYLRFHENLDSILERHRQATPDQADRFPRYAIIWALLKTYKWEYTLAILLKIVSSAAQTFTPLISRYLISYVEEKRAVPETPLRRGVGLCIGISLLLIIDAFLLNHSMILCRFVGANSKTILTKALIEKTLIASAETKHNYSKGKIISLISGDISRIDLAFGMVPFGLCFFVPVIIGIIILIFNIGVSALAGVGVFFIVILCMSYPAKSLVNLRSKANGHTDKRVSLMTEIFQSMKMIKLYSWEDAYETKVKEERKKEVKYVYKIQTVLNFITSLAISAPSLVSMTAFLVLSAVKKDQSASRIFSSLALFSLLSSQSIMLPYTISFLSDALTAVDRITKYLEASEEELQVENVYNDKLINDPNIAIKVVNGEFEWENFEDEDGNLPEADLESKTTGVDIELGILNSNKAKAFNGLHNINLEVYKDEFLVITGPIGSGKSSLLAAIGGVMKKLDGDVGVNGSLLLCGEPWIQNTTIKENILFGSQYDSERYQNTIKACDFATDLDDFPAGDITEIGERGVTLSGGQKARLNLARAVYANKEIYLFDDVLSAVDANVGKHIIANCLMGILSKKTRIIATHQLSLIKKADRVVFLNGDGTIDVGTEEELSLKNEKFVTLMRHTAKEEDPTKDRSKDHVDAIEGESEGKRKPTGILYGEEERALNSIPLSIYKQYFDAGCDRWPSLMLLVLVALLIASTFCYLFTNVWLSYWIENRFKGMSKGGYIGVYVMLTMTTVLFTVLEFALMGDIIVKASQRLNIQAVERVLHTPMRFMDTTPIGRAINRFSKDANTLDNEVGENLKMFAYLASSVIGTIILAIVYIPWFAIAVPFFFAIYLVVTNYYQATSREVKRLEAVVRSHIFNNFNEILNGMTTIKAYGAQSRFLTRNSLYSDRLNEVYFTVVVNQRWISLTLNCLASILIFIVTILAVTGQFKVSPAAVGLLTSYMIQLVTSSAAILRTYTEVENNMNSVERVCFYASCLEQESPYQISESVPHPDWPVNAEIEFKRVSFKYRKELPNILTHLSFHVQGGEKIGICGRTGAGKSSILSALYRLNELSEGLITIDGVNVRKLGLHTLRSKLSIIPQDPVLFRDSIRKNLDPFDESSDDKLWDSLRRSGLIDASDLESIKLETSDNYSKFHLESRVEDEGSNFSLGERQLLALARALVRQSKILILDEATSSVDYQTDALVQKTIAVEFKDCTILCIAHRLKTILNYDKILVLEKGELEEYDTPLSLFNKEGRFREMCESANITLNDFMTRI